MSDLARLVIAIDSSDARAAKRDLDALAGSGDKLMGVMRGLASAIGVTALAQQLFSVNKEFQQLQAQLVTVTGSAEAAESAFRFLEQFAQDTPFQLNEVTQAFTRLKATGLDATAEALTNWGNLASANSKNILETIQAVSAASFGETETMKQYGIIIRNLGDSVAITFKGATTQVKNSSSAIYAELQRLAAANFAGGMKRQMETLGGVASNLVDTWQSFMRAVGTSGVGAGVIGGIRSLTEWLDKAKQSLLRLASTPEWWEFVGSINIAAKQVFGLATQILGLGGAIGEAGVELGIFAKMWGLVSILVAGIRDAITLMTNSWKQSLADLYSGMALAVSGYRMMLDSLPASVQKRLGIDPQTIYQVAMLEIKLGDLAVAADKVATETAATSSSAYEEVMQGIEESAALAKTRAEEIKKLLGAAPGSLPGGPKGQDQASANELMRRAQFLKALEKEAAMLGATATEMKRYEASLVGLGNNASVQAALDKIIKFEAHMEALKERQARSDAWDKREQGMVSALEAEAQAYRDLAMNAVYPYLDALVKVNKTEMGLNDLLAKGIITADQHAEAMRRLAGEMPVMTEAFGDLRDTIQDWSRSSTEAFLDLAFKGKAAFSDLITSMLRDLARLAVQRNVMEPLFGYLAGAISSGFGGSTGTTATTGGTAGGGLNWGEASMQAPLKGAQTSIVVNVNQAKGDVSTNAESSTGLGRKIEAAVKSVMVNEMRPGGLLARA